MANDFHDVRFPLAISFGATGGPERRNEIVRLHSGRERRNQRHAQARRRFDAGTGVRSLEDLETAIAFFEARRGSIFAFRFRDPFDWKSCALAASVTPFDQPIGTGDGVRRAFLLVKTYGEGEDALARPIFKPLAGTVRLGVGGVEATPGDFTVDAATGMVEFGFGATPPTGATVTAGYEFDVPVRFDIDFLSVSLASFRAGQIPSLPLVEVTP